eukprot:2114749-Rhodomonas_salina.1
MISTPFTTTLAAESRCTAGLRALATNIGHGCRPICLPEAVPAEDPAKALRRSDSSSNASDSSSGTVQGARHEYPRFFLGKPSILIDSYAYHAPGDITELCDAVTGIGKAILTNSNTRNSY